MTRHGRSRIDGQHAPGSPGPQPRVAAPGPIRQSDQPLNATSRLRPDYRRVPGHRFPRTTVRVMAWADWNRCAPWAPPWRRLARTSSARTNDTAETRLRAVLGEDPDIRQRKELAAAITTARAGHSRSKAADT